MKKKIAMLLSLSMIFGSMGVPVYSAQDASPAEDDVFTYAEDFVEAGDTKEESVDADFEDVAEEEEVKVVALDEEIGSDGAQENEAESEESVEGDESLGGNETGAVVPTVVAVTDKNTIIVYNDEDAARYAVVIDPDDLTKGVSTNALKGEAVAPGGYIKITVATLADGSTKPLEYNKGYMVFASASEMVELSKENLIRWSEDDELTYTEAEDFTRIEAPEDVSKLLDGEKIGLAAFVQKNNTVKFKWNNKADSKTYKTFELFRLKSDGKWESIMPASGKRAYTEGVEHFQTSDKGYTEIYKLDCKDESGSTDSYVTIPAPMIYFVESGEAENTMDFAFTGFTKSPSIGYDLEVSTDKNFTSVNVDHEESVDMDYPIEFNISKKVKAQAFRADFYNEGTSLNVGTQYYCRVRATVSLGGITVKGAPCAVKAVKQGPVKCDLFDIIGITPDGNEVLGNDTWLPSVAEGYAVFSGPEPAKVKGYELLTCDTKYGIYKTLKKISVTDVKPYNPPQFQDFGENEHLYSIRLDFVSPEARYYAIRAISSTGNAKGGFADGTLCWSRYPKVSELQVADSDATSVTISFKGEAGVNEYWIYRDTASANLAKELSPSQYVGKVKNKFRKPGQSGTLNFKDKKGLIEGTVYHYTVRPVFSKAYADKQKYEMDFPEDKLVEGYGETLADPIWAKPSLENAVIKNVKTTVVSVKEVQITWSAIKGAAKYNIYMVEGSGEDDSVPMQKVLTVEKGSTEFTQRKAKVVVPKVGRTYSFGVNVGGNTEDSKYATMANPIATYPSNPAKLTALYSHYGNRGAKLTWTNPSEDKDYRSWIKYEIQYRDNEGKWDFLDYANATTSSYTDTYALTRGIERQYRMRAVYMDKESTAYNAKVTGLVKYCKPYRIAVANSSKDSIGSVTIDPGQTYTFRVYFYDRHGDTDVVTDTKLETVRISDSDIASYSTSGKDGDYAVVKVTGKRAGSTKLTVRARDYDDDSSRLSRTVTINVRNKPAS